MEPITLALLVVNCGLSAWAAFGRRTAKPAPEPAGVPELGTVARKEYHRARRDFHAEQVLVAARAARTAKEG